MSASKVLVYWQGEKLWSVLSESAVKGEAAAGTYTKATFEGKWYPCLIITKDAPETVTKAEKRFKEFLQSCLMEEAEEDVEKSILKFINETPAKMKERADSFTRSPTTPANVDGNDSFQYLRRENKEKKDKEKFQQMDEELRSLRRKYRKLEERVTTLEERKGPRPARDPSAEKKSTTAKAAEPEPSPSNDQQPSPDSSDFSTPLTEEGLLKSAKGIVGDQNLLKHLCLQVFSKEELTNCSRTGKRTIKNMDAVKPPLDPIKFGLLERVIMKVTSFDKPTFHKKFENQQKVIRRA